MLSEFKFHTNPMQSTAVWPASHVVIFPSIYAGVTVPWSIASIIMADDVNMKNSVKNSLVCCSF